MEITYTLQPRFCKVDLMLNTLIQLKIMQYWWWFWRGSDVGMEHQALTGILTEQKLIADCRYRVIKSSSLVPVLFREVFSHPYISLFHLLVNGFSVTCNNNNYHNNLLQTGFLGVYWSDRYITYTLVTNFPEIVPFIIGFCFTVWTKKSAKKIRKQVRGCLQNLYRSVAIHLKYVLLVLL